MGGAAAAIGGGLLGAISGSQKNVTGSSSQNISGINLSDESELEKLAGKNVQSSLGDISNLVGLGPGAQDITSSLSAQRGLAGQLESFAQGGFLPSESDVTRSREFAASQFAPQQEVLKQSYQDAQVRANQLATQLGRSVDDPIIQARLQTDLARQTSVLGAQQNAFASQFAQNLPQQRLQYQAQLADVRGSLASQALSNRQALLSLGSQVQSAERQFRLNTGQRYSNTTQEQSSGGGLGGAISGALGGAGAGLSFASMFGGGSKSPGQSGGLGGGLSYTPGGVGDYSSLTPDMGMFGPMNNPNIPPTAPAARSNRVTAGGFGGGSSNAGVPAFLQPNSTYSGPQQSLPSTGSDFLGFFGRQ